MADDNAIPQGFSVGAPPTDTSQTPGVQSTMQNSDSGDQGDEIPQGFSVGAPPSAPSGGIDTDERPDEAVDTRPLRVLGAMGAGVGEGLLHTINGAADLVGLHSDMLHSREEELKNDNANNPISRDFGYGGETLAEFLMGDEALKGLSLADRLAKSAQVMKLLQNSPRMIEALRMGASAGKAMSTLTPAEQALVKSSPTLTRLIGAGMDAIRAGAVQGTQTAVRDTGSIGDRLTTGAKDALTTAGVAGVIGGAGGLLASKLTKAGETAKGVTNLNNVVAGADSKEQVAADLATRINEAEKGLHQDYEKGINDLKERLDGTEIDAQDNSLADKAKELLQKPTPEDHPTLVAADKAAGAKLDKDTLALLQQIADGTEPLTPEEEEKAAEAAKAAKKPSGILGPDGKPASSGIETEEPELPAARPYNIDDLVKIRQRIRQAAEQYEPGDPNARVLKKLLYDNTDKTSAMDDTIEALAQQSGDKTATQDYRNLRANYRDKISAYDNPVIDKLREGKVDDAAKYFVGTKRTGSALPSGGSIRDNTNDLRKILGDQGLKNFGKKVFGTMMQDATESGRFNPAKFVDTMKRVSEETNNTLFDMKSANSGLRQLQRDAASAAKLQHLTRLGVLGPLSAGIGALTGGGLGAGIGTVLGLTVAEGGGIAKGRELLDYVANHPAVWKTYETAGKAVNSRTANVASTVVKERTANALAPTMRNILSSTKNSLGGN